MPGSFQNFDAVIARLIATLQPGSCLDIGPGSGSALFSPGSAPAVDLLSMPLPNLQALRGQDISMIFQEPLTALNPTQRIERQMLEVIRLHRPCSKQEARALAEAERAVALDPRDPDAHYVLSLAAP